MMRLDIEVSGTRSDDKTDEVLVEVMRRLEGMDIEIRYSSGDSHLRTFGTPWDYVR